VSELRIGTRGSQLALWQANTVAAQLQAAGAPPCRIVIIKTTGDQLQERPVSEVGGKRLFVKEIEDALLRNDVDLAVHSSKDMPAILPGGLSVAGVLPREDPRDAVVLPQGLEAKGLGLTSALSPQPSALAELLGDTPVIGTGSVRRVAQLLNLFPKARFENVRGNVDTRLRKLEEGQYDALVLAAAGLRRLGFGERISMTLSADVCVPAPGQGIVAIETRDTDRTTRTFVERITDTTAAAALDAERAVVEALGGGCQTPIGALATIVEGNTLELIGAVASLDGSRVIRATGRANRADAAELGFRVGHELIAKGASEILAGVRAQ
jgi:hydroxymethylbilane synthase